MAKKPTKTQLAQAEADEFRATVISLLNIEHPDWDDFDWRWLTNESRRKPDYRYTEKEQKILDKLIFNSKSFTEYAGHTIPELIAIACRHHCDLNEEGQEFVENLSRWGAVELKRRQIQRLAAICRRTERIGWDELKDERARTDVEVVVEGGLALKIDPDGRISTS